MTQGVYIRTKEMKERRKGAGNPGWKGEKVKINTQKQLDKEGIKGVMLLCERYALWWVLGEVRKNQRGIKC